ncbi:MAG: DUF883 family protein [Verrucomicrobiota bacterium]
MQDSVTGPSKEKVAEDLRILAQDAEELLKVTAGEVSDKLGEKARAARGRLIATLDKAKDTCHRIEEKAIDAAKATDKAIRTHPYQAMGIAFGVGLLVGVLLARRK